MDSVCVITAGEEMVCDLLSSVHNRSKASGYDGISNQDNKTMQWGSI